MLISIAEYAKKHGKDASTVRHRLRRGAFKTAIKIGRNWVIDEDEEWVDYRYKGVENEKSKRNLN